MQILLLRMKYTHEIVGTHEGDLLPEHAPGARSGSKSQKPLVCSAFKNYILFRLLKILFQKTMDLKSWSLPFTHTIKSGNSHR